MTINDLDWAAYRPRTSEDVRERATEPLERELYGQVQGTARVTVREYPDGCVYAVSVALGPGGRPGRTTVSEVTTYPNGATVLTPVDQWWTESDALVGMQHHHVTRKHRS